MRVAFYVARTGTVYDRLIDLCSGKVGYSHVELVFSDGVFFSSSPRDGGCRMKRIEPDHHWDFVDLSVSAQQERRIRDRCEKMSLDRIIDEVKARHRFGPLWWLLGDIRWRYDWFGVLRFWLPIPLKLSRHRKFCSEVCIEELQRERLLNRVPSLRVSPNVMNLIVDSARGLARLLVSPCQGH